MVCRLRNVQGTRGDKAPRTRINPTRSSASKRGAEPEPSAGREKTLRRKSRNKFPPMAANRMPPSGRKRMHAPMERPPPSHIADDRVELESFPPPRILESPDTARS